MCVDRLRPVHWWNLESGPLINSGLSVPGMALSIYMPQSLQADLCLILSVKQSTVMLVL